LKVLTQQCELFTVGNLCEEIRTHFVSAYIILRSVSKWWYLGPRESNVQVSDRCMVQIRVAMVFPELNDDVIFNMLAKILEVEKEEESYSALFPICSN